jgi:hypothetical protein
MKASWIIVGLMAGIVAAEAAPARSMAFEATTPRQARRWQRDCRQKLFELLMGGARPQRVPLQPEVRRRLDMPAGGYVLEELTFQSLPDRRAHAWMAAPKQPRGKVGAVLAIHGHGGNGEEVVRGLSLYWYGRALAEMGYVVIAPDVGQHELQHTNWTLMGERVWDALRCLDYLETRPEVDRQRLAVAGLSLGGETTMYVAALDERVKAACSSGWLTTVANMKNGHCPCFNFPGLEENFEFSDIFACVAPRPLVLELGEKERAPGGFPVSIGRGAFEEIRRAYRVFDAEQNLQLTVHPGGHVFVGRHFWAPLREKLGTPWPWAPPQSPIPNPKSKGNPKPEVRKGVEGNEMIRQSDLGPLSDFRVREAIAGVRIGGISRALFPLTPALSPRGREPLIPSLEPSERLVSVPAPLPLLPLPWGEGWGEGKGSLGKPSHSSSAIGSWTSDLPRELLRRGEIARRCFARALGVLDGWWATRDRETGLYPRRLDQPVWAPADNAADMFPFLALTAYYLAPERLPEILDVIPKERTLTTRHAGLPDWFSLTNRAFTYAETNLTRLIFGAAEYCKDGLIPMTEVMGRGPWFDRMVELMDAIFAAASVPSDFGPLPADDTEVNGDLLQALARLYAMTREAKYLHWAERIGDAYCFEVLPRNGGLPPHRWDFTNHRAINDTLNLNDHGNEIIGGLAELFVITKEFYPEKAARYREPMRLMFHRLLDKARNEDGLWFNLIRASTGEVLRQDTPDTWGYALSAAVTFGRASGDRALEEAAWQALRRIDQPRYLDWNGADAYADSIEGALYLLNRWPAREGRAWLEKVLPLFLAQQRDNGIVEGWYGDGNYARTALLAALYFTQGASCHPWRADLRVGAVYEGDTLSLILAAEKDWEGQLRFDTPRHREHLRLPVNYARLNEFPEWFAVEAGALYRLRLGKEAARRVTGAELVSGIPVRLKAGRETVAKLVSAK